MIFYKGILKKLESGFLINLVFLIVINTIFIFSSTWNGIWIFFWNLVFIILSSVFFIFRSIGVWIYGFCVLFIIGLIIVNSTTFIFNSKCFWNGSTFLWFVFLIFDLRFGSSFCSFIRDFSLQTCIDMNFFLDFFFKIFYKKMIIILILNT